MTLEVVVGLLGSIGLLLQKHSVLHYRLFYSLHHLATFLTAVLHRSLQAGLNSVLNQSNLFLLSN